MPKKRVLLVDDNSAVRSLVRRLFELEPFLSVLFQRCSPGLATLLVPVGSEHRCSHAPFRQATRLPLNPLKRRGFYFASGCISTLWRYGRITNKTAMRQIGRA